MVICLILEGIFSILKSLYVHPTVFLGLEQLGELSATCSLIYFFGIKFYFEKRLTEKLLQQRSNTIVVNENL